MCITLNRAILGNTIAGEYEADQSTRVVFYQNEVGDPMPVIGRYVGPDSPENWPTEEEDSSGNALIIPLMTDDFDSVKLLEDTLSTPNLLDDLRLTVQPPAPRGIAFGLRGDVIRIRQFDIYTLVEASRASLIPQAVEAVEARKRPPLAPEIFQKLEEWYKCPFAIACFDNNETGKSKPIAYKFKPKFPGQFMIYTLDSHDGYAPNLNARVELDHAVFVGSYKMKSGRPVSYSDNIPAGLKKYIPSNVVGMTFGKRMINGDFVVPAEDVRAGRFNAYRVAPPHAPRREPIKIEQV